MFDPSSSEIDSNDLSRLSAAASTDTPYGLPIEQVSENLSVAGQDLITVAFDAVSDHVLLGETQINFAIKNQGTQDVGRFSADIVYSKNGKIGDRDDIVVGSYSFRRLDAGDTLTRSVNIDDLPLDELNASAIKEDRPGRGRKYQSRNQDFLGLVIDPGNDISEANERNNVNQKEGLGKDDITYFPWDVNDDGVVSSSEARAAKKQLGRSTRRAKPYDFDGDGTVTQVDVDAIQSRVGYSINPKVTEPAVFAGQVKDGRQLEPILEGVVAEIGEVKKVQAKFLKAPKNKFANITRDIGKAGEFSFTQKQLESIYGDSLPAKKTQSLVIETLDKRGKVTSSKKVRYKPVTSGPNIISPPKDPGETTARAFNLKQLNGKLTVAESVSDSDRFDYYKFQVKDVSDLTIDFNVLNESYDANVTIVDAANNAVFSPSEINFTDELGSTLIEPGTYYARVAENSFGGSTGYRLSLDAKALPDNRPQLDPGETTARAFNLGTLGVTQTLMAAVNDSDTLDYYKFELDGPSNVTIDLDVLNERYDADVTIVDAANNAVFNPGETNFTDEFATTFLESGVYYARVQENSFGSGTDYALRLGATAISNNIPPADAGETPARAIDLGVLSNTQTLNAFISDSDTLDYYRFELDDNSTVTIDLDVINERYDADVSIVDVANNVVFNPGETNFTDEFATTFLEAGVYFARINENSFGSGTAYELKLGAKTVRNNFPPTDPGETIADAFNLGVLSNGTQRLRSFISDSDRFDYYQFRLNGTKNVRVDLDVINERYDADVRIVDASGRTIFDPRETNFTDELGTTRLSGGIYYALVSENSFGSGTEYLLKLGIS
ncbi:MAG: CARDB domain-containing protein [Cyanobacteria bacterium J06576_12]